MINIRPKMFHTNSSSQHAVALISKKQYSEWKNGDLWLCFNAYDWHIPAAFTLDEFLDYLYNTDSQYDTLREEFCSGISYSYKIIDNTVFFYDMVDKPVDVRYLKDHDTDKAFTYCLYRMWIFSRESCEFSWEGVYANDPVSGKDRVIVSAEIWD